MTSPWNRSFNGSWQDLRNENIAKRERADLLFAFRQMAIAIAVAAVIAVMMHSCTDAIIHQSEIDERHVMSSAFRASSPTHEQLWALDHLTEVSRVAHAERQGGGM